MNRAEYITASVGFAMTDGRIAPVDAVRVLMSVACMLNSGQDQNDIDLSPEMEKLWKEVRRKWGPR